MLHADYYRLSGRIKPDLYEKRTTNFISSVNSYVADRAGESSQYASF